ncbi:MAG: hypothetical protein ABEJ69_01685 [Candidatus Nanohaloarchaea archaeon]
MTGNETAKCPYCGEVFEGTEDQDAITQEGIHRAEEHVNQDGPDSGSSKGKNIINRWKTEGKRA